MSILLLQLLGRPTFYSLHQVGRTQGRGRGSEHVHVILADVSLFDPDIQAETRLTDQFSCSMGDLALQNMVAVLCHLYQMVLDLVDFVRPAPVLAHFLSGEARSPWKTSLPRR